MVRWLIWFPALLVIIGVLYYGVGALIIHEIDDDIAFGLEASPPQGGSQTAAVMADLIEREIDQNGWIANSPPFYPGYVLDNMPNFQNGIIDALSRVSIELLDQIARSRGSSSADRDLEIVTGRLKFPGDQWVWDPSVSWAPQRPSQSYYREAATALRRYNDRLAAGNAVFERRDDNLLTTLDRISKDLGSTSAGLYQHMDDYSGRWLDTEADDHFYRAKGKLYAYFIVLRAFEDDFAERITDRNLTTPWQQMLGSFEEGATLYPWIVVNGVPDGQLTPSHLAAQGFYLLRARTQLREISDILLK
ncbi:MAG: DUF2333 family protein [Geminicoccaceae bacterium]